MLTGLLPYEHGAVDDGMQVADVPRLPEVLAEQGYVTGGFVTSLFVGAQFGMDRGFDHFDDFGIRTKAANLKDEVQAEEVVNEALFWVEEQAGESVFLFVHLYDVHYPYDAPYPYDRHFDEAGNDVEYRKYFFYLKHPLGEEAMRHQVAQYDEEIAYVDQQLGRLFDAFEDRDVVFVVTADHGEEFGERGSWGHGHTLYPEQLHVPLIVAGHGVDAGVVEQAVGSQDIAPTMAKLGGAQMDGVDLLDSPPEGRVLLSDTSRFKTNRVGVYQDGLRLDWDLVAEEKTLYADPLERTPVDRPEDTEALTAVLAQHLGTPWVSEQPVAITGGVALSEGVASDVGTGAFALIPVDARVGEFSVANPPAPGDSLQFHGLGQEAIVLDPEQRAALEALGYIQ
jgi:arylsulfatase A-like enzyme